VVSKSQLGDRDLELQATRRRGDIGAGHGRRAPAFQRPGQRVRLDNHLQFLGARSRAALAGGGEGVRVTNLYTQQYALRD